MVLDSTIIINYLKEHKKQYSDMGIDIIGIFGSYAKSENSEESDIDILYDTQKGVSDLYDKKQVLKEELEKVFDTKIDLASRKYLKPYVKDEILQDLIYV